MGNYYGKVRSGITFLYRPDGIESQVTEVRLKRPVVDSLLMYAVRVAFERYPYLLVKLKRRSDGMIHTVKNPVAPIPARRRRLRALQSMASMSNVVDITFWNCSIYVSFHHSICDGLGIMNFVKTLMYYYISFSNPKLVLSVPGLKLSSTPISDAETAEPTVDGCFVYDPANVYQVDCSHSFRLPEVEKEVCFCRWELTIDEAEFVRLAKMNNTTPSVLVSMLMHRAIVDFHPDSAHKVVSNIVCDMRSTIGCPETYRNCVICQPLVFVSQDCDAPIDELGRRMKAELNKLRQLDTARARALMMKTVADKIDNMPSFESRVEMMNMMESMVNDTFTMSYLGRADLGDLEGFIDGIHIYTSGDRGLTIEMIAVDGRMILDIKQSFSTAIYVNALMRQFASLGLNVKISDQIFFDVPKDKSSQPNVFERMGDRLNDVLKSNVDQLVGMLKQK